MEVFEQAEAISGERFKDLYWERDTTCLKCPVACGKDFKVDEGEFAGTRWKMPEYESIFALGSMLENANAPSLIKANELCDQLGMDTISMGVTIAFAMECAARGLLSAQEIITPCCIWWTRQPIGKVSGTSWLRARVVWPIAWETVHTNICML